MNELLQPIFLNPYLKETIWGGQKLKKRFNKYQEDILIGESWEICGLEINSSTISNGPFYGESLYKLINLFPEEILGKALARKKEFPLLCKFIDANTRLSVQVHPDDNYALKIEGEKRGKAELWYIVDAKEESFIILGLKPGISKEELSIQCKNNGDLKTLLNFVPVKKGEMYYIPPGTIHAIGEGVVVAEIQQSSDLTYRFYDWDRLDKNGCPRELHIDKAIDVVDLGKKTFKYNGEINNEYFKVKVYELENDELKLDTSFQSFHAIMLIEGEGEIVWNQGKTGIKLGQSILIPALLGKYLIRGNCKFLVAKPPLKLEYRYLNDNHLRCY